MTGSMWRTRIAAVVVAAGLALPAGSAGASDAQSLDATRRRAALAQEDLATLMERYRSAALEADDASARSFALGLHAQEARASEDAARDTFTRSIRAIYMDGGDRTIDMMLGATSFAELEARLPYARRGLDRSRRDAADLSMRHAVVQRLVDLAERAQAEALRRERTMAELRDEIVRRLDELREQVRALERAFAAGVARVPSDRWQALFERWLATQDDIDHALALRRRARGEAMFRAAAPYLGPRPDCSAPDGLRSTGQSTRGEASWYGPGFVGNNTASGAVFDPARYTVAHKSLPFGLFLLIRYRGGCVMTLLNDRGPYVEGRILDLSEAAAKALGLGVGVVDATIYVRG